MKHYTVTAAIITNNNQYLAVQRGPSKYTYVSNKYEFPGGKIEENETFEQCLARELFEELDIDVEILSDDYFMTVDHEYPDFRITMHCYLVPVMDRSFTLKEHTDYRWTDLNNIMDLQWAPADIPIVVRLVE